MQHTDYPLPHQYANGLGGTYGGISDLARQLAASQMARAVPVGAHVWEDCRQAAQATQATSGRRTKLLLLTPLH